MYMYMPTCEHVNIDLTSGPSWKPSCQFSSRKGVMPPVSPARCPLCQCHGGRPKGFI